MTRVLVTDARLPSAVAVIRSLGRRGMDVIAADSRRVSAGFYSRYASARLLYPSPEASPDEVVEVLLREARDRQIDLIFPVTDELVLPLSAARERFASTSVLALPEAKALAISQDKLATLQLARKLGIPTPRTALIATVDEALGAARELGWPIVVKPQASRAFGERGAINAFGVVYANSDEQLERSVRRLQGRTALLQEYCVGEARGVGLLLHRGAPLVGFQYRRLREVPISGGPSSFRESVALETVHYDYAVSLLGALDWTGLAMVEFKGGEDAPKLMEINGRIWGSLALAVKSGVDFPGHAAEMYLRGPDSVAQERYSVGVRSRDIRLELSWIASTLRAKREYPFIASPRRREALRAAVRLFAPSDGYDVMTRDDPLAGVAEVASFVPRLYRKTAATAIRWLRGGLRLDD
jgi:predicted ATP-grasp superfamily ATP-dependent carboligase